MMPDSPLPTTHAALRDLPSVNALIGSEALQEAAERYGVTAVTDAARAVLAEVREELIKTTAGRQTSATADLVERCQAALEAAVRPSLRPVINATGILLHTGLGRAPLAEEAIQAALEVSRGYCSVELDLEQGTRSQRSRAVEGLLRQLTGAEAALVVNNNAGATGLAVAALAAGREVIVSHGELIEIGGGYRMPEVVTAYGASLRAVGTTNKTRPSDYERAIGEQTGALLVVHPSNYQVAGFTQRPDLKELTEIAKRRGVSLVHDVGSGALIDFTPFGCEGEPVVADSVRDGADLVLFSGDKLLGGPQCGIVVGKRDLVERLYKHPLARALRVDKITLAALHATLALYLDEEKAKQRIPLLQMLSVSAGELRERAERLAGGLLQSVAGWEAVAVCDEAFVGGGSLPHQSLPSWSVAVTPTGGGSVESLAQRLRTGDPSVVGRRHEGGMRVCLHGVKPAQDEALERVLIDSCRATAAGS